MGLGDYPKEYDPKTHGPYDPAKYYGKPDTPFGDVKLLELPKWLARRTKTPSAFMGACSRAWWRWQHKYMQPRKVGAAPFFQILVANMVFFYAINYGRISKLHISLPTSLLRIRRRGETSRALGR